MTSSQPQPFPNAYAEKEPYAFDFVPELKDLLPETGGHPGLKYAVALLEHAPLFQNDPEMRWSQDPNYPHVFKVTGPKGFIHLQLWRRGKIIQGASTQSGARECSYDKEIAVRTGLTLTGQGPWPDDAPAQAPVKKEEV